MTYPFHTCVKSVCGMKHAGSRDFRAGVACDAWDLYDIELCASKAHWSGAHLKTCSIVADVVGRRRDLQKQPSGSLRAALPARRRRCLTTTAGAPQLQRRLAQRNRWQRPFPGRQLVLLPAPTRTPTATTWNSRTTTSTMGRCSCQPAVK